MFVVTLICQMVDFRLPHPRLLAVFGSGSVPNNRQRCIYYHITAHQIRSDALIMQCANETSHYSHASHIRQLKAMHPARYWISLCANNCMDDEKKMDDDENENIFEFLPKLSEGSIYCVLTNGWPNHSYGIVFTFSI